MKRLGRRLFNFAAAASLLLCITTVVFWARSFFAWDEISIAFPSILFRVGSASGSLHLQSASSWPGGVGLHWERFGPYAVFTPRVVLGQRIVHGADVTAWNPPVGAWSLNSLSMIVQNDGPTTAVWMNTSYRRIPFAVVVIVIVAPVAAIFFITQLLVYRSNRRLSCGLCQTCGYDLRATPDRCPECGTIPSTTSQNQLH